MRGSKVATFKWLEKPKPYLDHKRPIELAESDEGATRVLEYMKNWITQHV
ncbi:MbcA/ParS/Xre antitoxin family protein [Pseudomonas amygdali]